MFPWIVGPLVAGGDLSQFVRHVTPVGVLSEFVAKVVRDHGVPVLTIVPGAMLALGILIVCRLGTRAGRSQGRPFEPLVSPPVALLPVEASADQQSPHRVGQRDRETAG